MRTPAILAALLLAALPLAAAPARGDDYKVIYLSYEPRHVAEGKEKPFVMEDGVLLSEGKRGPQSMEGCQPLKPCRGTFEIPVLGEMLDAMYLKNWELVTVVPVTSGELKGGYLAFLKRRGLLPVPRP
jgi:hypothetical protein